MHRGQRHNSKIISDGSYFRPSTLDTCVAVSSIEHPASPTSALIVYASDPPGVTAVLRPLPGVSVMGHIQYVLRSTS